MKQILSTASSAHSSLAGRMAALSLARRLGVPEQSITDARLACKTADGFDDRAFEKAILELTAKAAKKADDADPKKKAKPSRPAMKKKAEEDDDADDSDDDTADGDDSDDDKKDEPDDDDGDDADDDAEEDEEEEEEDDDAEEDEESDDGDIAARSAVAPKFRVNRTLARLTEDQRRMLTSAAAGSGQSPAAFAKAAIARMPKMPTASKVKAAEARATLERVARESGVPVAELRKKAAGR